MASKKSVTGPYLTGVRSVPVPAKRRKRQPNKTLRVVGAKANNLRDITVEFPLGIFTCVTGVSGGGKSTLTIETLYKAMSRKPNGTREISGTHGRNVGLARPHKTVETDQPTNRR